jgi:S1/P1 Nuclease
MNAIAVRVLITLLVAAPAWSWGFTGHRIIALIAEQRLSPPVREEVRKLLMDGKYSLADISVCADRLRDTDRKRPEDEMCRWVAGAVPSTNEKWHYIQIPVPTQAKALAAFCPQGDCVTAKINSFALRLRTSMDQAEQRQALLFLVHLVADVHQPLHAVDRSCDKGGTSERVNFFVEGKKHADVNLHHVWDTDELELLMTDYNVTDERAIAGALIASISSTEAESWIGATADQMAWESYKIAIARVYPSVPYQNFCGPQEAALIETDLSDSYEKDGSRVVQKQLMKAGVRLAAMLESALGDH